MGVPDRQHFRDIYSFAFDPVECCETSPDMEAIHFFLRSSLRGFDQFLVPTFTGKGILL